MRRGEVWGRWAITIALPVIVGACAATPRDASLAMQDPNEVRLHTNPLLSDNQQQIVHISEPHTTVPAMTTRPRPR